MKTQKFVVNSVITAVLLFALNYLWYEVIAGDYYTQSQPSRAEPLFLWLVIGTLLFAIGFVYFYGKTAGSGSAVNEGIRFGFWATVFASAPINFVMYAFRDIPMKEPLIDTLYCLVSLSLVAIVLGFLSGKSIGDRGKGSGSGDI